MFISAALRASALDLTSNLATGDVLQLEGGLLSSEGSLSTGSTASLSAVPARAGLTSGSSAVGATLTLSAPPAANGLSPSVEMTRYLDGATCTFACFGRTFVLGDQNVTVTSGEPKVSTVGSPLEVRLRRTATNLERGFSYSNATPAETKPALGVVGPMVSGGALGGPDGPSGPDVLRGSGYLDATGTGPTSVRVSSSVRLDHLALFPTTFAPAGAFVIQCERRESSTVTDSRCFMKRGRFSKSRQKA